MTGKRLMVPNNSTLFFKLATVDRKLEFHAKERERLDASKIKTIKSYIILCTACTKDAKMLDWKFIQNHWYEGPHGCTEGAEWYPSQTEVCHIVCPHCHAKLYIYTHPQKKEILKLVESIKPLNESDLFSVVENVFDNT